MGQSRNLPLPALSSLLSAAQTERWSTPHHLRTGVHSVWLGPSYQQGSVAAESREQTLLYVSAHFFVRLLLCPKTEELEKGSPNWPVVRPV